MASVAGIQEWSFGDRNIRTSSNNCLFTTERISTSSSGKPSPQVYRTESNWKIFAKFYFLLRWTMSPPWLLIGMPIIVYVVDVMVWIITFLKMASSSAAEVVALRGPRTRWCGRCCRPFPTWFKCAPLLVTRYCTSRRRWKWTSSRRITLRNMYPHAERRSTPF